MKYKEGVLVGYRWFDARNIAPLFPFGHGLSYTTFRFSGIRVDQSGEGVATISVTVTNDGPRDGREVVQLYIEDVECGVNRPVRELKGFRKVALPAGASTEVSFTITERDCSFWDVAGKAWKCEPGTFVAHVGSSSRDLPLRAEFTVA